MEKIMEVELRALIPDPIKFQEQLKQKGAKYKKSSYLRDVYFCDKKVTTLEEVEMRKIGSYSLRLRVTQENDKEVVSINTKTITREDDHHAWEEHEVTINNFKEAALILTKTEFRAFFQLEKHRHTYSFNGMEILVEEIVDFGGGVEVEIMCSPGEEDVSKEKIRNLLVHDLDLNESDIMPKSITSIIMRQRAFKQNIFF